jgi:hypothetical protein
LNVRHPRRFVQLAAIVLAIQGCSSGTIGAGVTTNVSLPPAATAVDSQQSRVAAQTARSATGSLRQDAISLRFTFRGVLARIFPMDESVISLLAPDSHRALRDLLNSQNVRIERARTYTGKERFSIWYVSYYALEPDSRFSPSELVIRAAGRDFRPLDIIALSTGFSQQRIQQGQSQTALYLFDPAVDVGQPLEATMEDVRNTEWAVILRELERERSRLRSAAIDTVAITLRRRIPHPHQMEH